LCVLASFGDLFRPRRIFFFYYLSINSTAGTMTWRHPTRSAQVGSLLHRASPTAYASYFLIVALFHKKAATKVDAPYLSLSLLI
jgi:hypothetical protein